MGHDAPFRVDGNSGEIVHRIDSPPQDLPGGGSIAQYGGAIASVTKLGKGQVKLTFSSDKQKTEISSCDSVSFHGWSSAGSPIYTPNCHFTGQFRSVELAPGPATIVGGCTAGLAVGRSIDFSDPDHPTTVASVFADKTRKKLVAVGCVLVE